MRLILPQYNSIENLFFSLQRVVCVDEHISQKAAHNEVTKPENRKTVCEPLVPIVAVGDNISKISEAERNKKLNKINTADH